MFLHPTTLREFCICAHLTQKALVTIVCHMVALSSNLVLVIKEKLIPETLHTNILTFRGDLRTREYNICLWTF